MNLTTNFTRQEFECKDGSEMPENVFTNIKVLASNLQVLRDELCQPITITSGYRSPSHNASIGGAARSQHLYGTAADFKVAGYTPQQVADKIEQLIAEGRMSEGGLKAYSGWIHYDCRQIRARW